MTRYTWSPEQESLLCCAPCTALHANPIKRYTCAGLSWDGRGGYNLNGGDYAVCIILADRKFPPPCVFPLKQPVLGLAGELNASMRLCVLNVMCTVIWTGVVRCIEIPHQAVMRWM